METLIMDLGKQVGPLPLGAWFAVLGTGLGIAYYNRGSEPATADPNLVSSDGGGLTVEDQVGTGASGQWTNVTPPAPVTDAPPQDNDEWGRLAINRLITDGYDPALAQSAISHALQGSAISVREWALWSTALVKLGAPPFPVDVPIPSSVPGVSYPAPTPAPKPAAPKPAAYKLQVLAPGATFAKLAKRHYGNGNLWGKIYNANKKGIRRANGTPGWVPAAKGKPNTYIGSPGRTLIIPR